MKVTIFIITLFFALINSENEWELFKLKYNKTYNNKEDEYRKGIFFKTLSEIKAQNENFLNGVHTFQTSINEFADLTDEEFQNQYANAQPIPNETWDSLPESNVSLFNLPETVNWVDYGFRNPVINQGSCGSCYAMASTAAVEGHLYIKNKQVVQLSQQEIIDCSSNYGNKGCQYGFMQATFNYIKDRGVGAAASNPYKGYITQCNYGQPRYNIRTWYRSAQNDEYALMQAVNKGPVVVLINAGLNSFKYYNGGLYYDSNCYLNPQGVNHFVTVVGYGLWNNKTPYWVMKNSWGANWGSGGYIYMARHANNQCGIAFQPIYPEI